MWGRCQKFEDGKVMGNGKEWRLGKVGAEDDGSYILTLSCM